MISLYESILQSTNSGRYHAPLKWSKSYSVANYKKAAEAFCKCYGVDVDLLKSSVQSRFYAFSNYQEIEHSIVSGKMVSKMVSIKNFKFVEDPLFIDKLAINTKYNKKALGNFASMFGLNDSMYFIYFEADGVYYYFNQATARIEKVTHEIILNYLKGR